MTQKKVLTIQDISCVGQCSLTVALPIISACGVETIILPSAVLSTHTGGFTGYTFRDLTDDIPMIMEHWMREGLSFDCLYTGYLGSVTQIEYVSLLRRNVINENGLLIVDPAMADHGKLYKGFDDSFVSRMASLCGTADIILPNMTEAAFMTNTELKLKNHTEEYIFELLTKLSELGAKNIILKGINYDDSKVGVAIYNSATKELQYVFNDKQEGAYHGTGDCYASAFTGAMMQGLSMHDAAELASSFVVESIKNTIGDDNHPYGVKFEKALRLLVEKLN